MNPCSCGISGNDGIGGLNSFVESLSGTSSRFLDNAGVLIPLGFAFSAGMVLAVNPCCFAMLPAYLGLYLGADESSAHQASAAQRLGKALLVGGAVTAGFVLVFSFAGILLGGGGRALVAIFPWVGLAVGVLLTFVGAWFLGGSKLYSALPLRVATRIGDPTRRDVRGYMLFGVSYGTASLSCTLPGGRWEQLRHRRNTHRYRAVRPVCPGDGPGYHGADTGRGAFQRSPGWHAPESPPLRPARERSTDDPGRIVYSVLLAIYRRGSGEPRIVILLVRQMGPGRAP